VSFTTHFADKDGRVLTFHSGRCGSHLWHKLLLPAIRAHCAQNSLRCEIRDTTTPETVPRPKPRPSR
jgi:hypothetical protein